MPSSDATYKGRPDIPGLTAITLRIRVNTVGGMVPLCVHGTALECTWTGPATGNPYEDLEFTWDFGDPAATRTMTNPTTEEVVSTNSDQVGPEAVHVYDEPGTYTVTVTARGWNGSAFITATASTTVMTAATVRVKPFNATTGTYTLKVQQARHARAARFDSQRNQFLYRPAGHTLVPGSAGMCVSGWFRSRNADFGWTIASYFTDASGKRSWKLTNTSAGLVRFQVGDATTGSVTATTVTAYDDTAWHHVVAWCDVATGEVGIAVDGVVGTPAARTPGLAMRAPSDTPLAFGAEFDSAVLRKNVAVIDVDEWALWNRPPTETERAWLYNSGNGRHWADIAASSPPAGLTTGLLAWWTFDERGGPTWADSTGNGHALRDYGIPLCYAGIAGVTPKVINPGGAETTSLAYDADITAIHNAVVAAAATLVPGLTTADIYRENTYNVLRFGGAATGQNWTIAPGATAGGFDGTVDALGYEDANGPTTITATAWDTERAGEVYLDSNAPDGGTGTALAPYNSDAALLAAINQRFSGPNRKIRIAAGSDFTIATETSVYPMSPTLIQKWGEGANPVLRTGNGGGMLRVSCDNGYAVRNLVIDRVNLVGNMVMLSTSFTDPTTELHPHHSGVHLLDVHLTGPYVSGTRINLGTSILDNCGFWGGSISGGDGPAPGIETNGRAQSMGMDCGSWGSIVGAAISGGGTPYGSNGVTFCHHVYWSAGGHATLARWIRFGAASPYAEPAPNGDTHYELNFCLKCSAGGNEGEVPLLHRGFLIDGCVLTGTQNPGAFGRLNNLVPLGNGYTQVVVQNNRMYKSTVSGNQFLGFYFADVGTGTMRDNTTWNTSGLMMIPNDVAFPAEGRFHRNRIYVNTGNAAWNAGIYARQAAGLEVLDNVVHMAGTNSLSGVRRGVMVLGSWDAFEALDECTIDRNQYYYPGQADSAVFVDETPSNAPPKSLALWQARGWDVNGVIADPEWPDPANGDFGDPFTPTPPSSPGSRRPIFSRRLFPGSAVILGGRPRRLGR